MPIRPFKDCRLYTFVDFGYLDGRDPVELARQLCDGGADVVQLRAKELPKDDIRKLAPRILEVVSSSGAEFVLNDHPDVALEVGAPCVHLGQEDFFGAGLLSATEVTHGRMALGLSTHAPDQCERAVSAKPDYVAIGPVFATPTKPGRPGVSLNYVHWAAAHVLIPWFAIGGINFETLDSVLEAGATRICVVGAILRAPDVAKACREFKRRLEGKA